MYNFEKLEVWQKAREFIKKIYGVTARYPSEEKFGLAQHTRTSAISILSNIAEGGSRFSNTESKRFMEIAVGSLYETVSQLFVGFDNSYLEKEAFDSLYSESETIAKILSGLSSFLKQKQVNKP